MNKNLKIQVLLNAVDKLTAPFRNTSKQIKSTSQAIIANKNLLKKLENAQERVKKTGLTQAQERLKNKIEKTTQEIKKQTQALEKLNQQKKKQEKYNKKIEVLKNTSNNLKQYGQQSMITAASTGMVAGSILSTAIEFEKAFSKVQALTRLDKIKDAERIKALRDQAIKLGAETAFTQTEVAEAQGYLAMAGFNDKQIKSSVPSMLNMSMASGTDLARVADIASDISSGFKIQADDMGRVADVLTLTFTTSNTSLETLYETMKEGAPIATAAGQSFESAAALAGLLGNVGIKGSQAGTTLKNMFVRLAAPPKEAEKALKKLGVSTKDAKGNLKQVPEILKQIMQKTEKMGTAKRLEYFDNIFGKIGLAGASELVTQAKDTIQNYENMLKDAKGTAEKVSRTMTDNVAGDFKTLSSAKEAIGTSIFDIVSTDLREFLGKITDLLRGVNQWINANQELTANIVKVGSVIAVVIGALGALSLFLGYIVYPVARTILGFGKLILFLGKLGISFLAIIPKIIAFSAALLTNPITWIIAGIVALIAAIYLLWKNWDKVIAALVAGWQWLKTACSEVWESIKNIVFHVWNGIFQFLGGIWEHIKEAFNGGIGGVSKLIIDWSPIGLFYKAFSAVLNYFGVELPASFSDVGSLLMEKLSSGIVNALGKVKDTISNVGSSVWGWFKEKIGIDTDTKATFTTQTTTNHVPPVNKWSGGYAGNGGKYQPMGIFHGGEYIMTKEATSRLGVPLLNALNYGKKAMLTAGMGLSVATAQPFVMDNRPPLSPTTRHLQETPQPMQVTINIHATAGQRAEDIAREVEKALVKIEQQKQARLRSALRDRD
ncbi:phage tail tape measure protein, TP901 family [Histophilus somni 2336]|uniref:phage tail tape measure protein n=2 Tax=Histophilus somni TaxID=731 RepID=UPI000045D61C|nr:phage tail tape measure protein [Histophilus somni]ACA30880.1 phage tail tape measure protein, TP901 family [Histophilus somni 2336]